MNPRLRRTALRAYERFLRTIPLTHYRSELLTIKTVEQDLPPLAQSPSIYL